MKALKTIQIISKFAMIMSKFVRICCIVGLCGCGVGVLALVVGGNTVKIGGVTLHSLLDTQANVSLGTILAAISVGVFLCAGELVVAKLSETYFRHELEAGTPFTHDGAMELRMLGVHMIWVPIVAMVCAKVAQTIFAKTMENVQTVSLSNGGSVAAGIALIVVSILCEYGAEISAREKADDEV